MNDQLLYAINPHATIERITLGDHTLLCIDNFLQNPQAMVDFASRYRFEPYPGLAEKKGYPGIRLKAPEDYSYNITTHLEPILKQELNIPAQLDIRKSVCVFSLIALAPEVLSPLQRTPHFDASTPNHIAVLLYLCGEEHGGTAFYRHNATGLQQITAENREHYLDVYYDEINKLRPRQEYFGESSEFFTKIGMISARFNRLVAYRGSLLHSPYINPALSIDTNPRSGRLTVNTFYDF